jgi:protoporphyrinogen oxidase
VTAAGPKVLVLGAGLAGLRAAIYLLEKGCAVTLLEKLAEPGGMARSHELDGFTFDHGPHGFMSRDQWINEEFEEVVGPRGGWYGLTKWSQIHWRQRYYNFPLKLRDIILKMDPYTVGKTILFFLWARLRMKLRNRPAANAEEYLVDQFGRVLYNEFFGPYTKKVWGVEPRELDADFTRDRVPSLHLWDIVRKLFSDPARDQQRMTPSGRVITHDLHTGYYPKRGAQALPLGYMDKARRLGAEFRFLVEIDAIDREAGMLRGRENGTPITLPFDRVVSTIPIDALLPRLLPPPPPEIAQLATGLRYRGIILVNLCVNRPQVISPHWIYFTDRLFNRISEYRHFSQELAPPGKTGICLELGGNANDALWNAPDDEIVRHCVLELVELDLLRLGDVEGALVIREPNAYPLYDVGYRARIDRLITWLEESAGIVTAGRQGRFLYCNQDAAIKSGFEAGAAAARLLETGSLGDRPLQEDVRPRRKIVG